MNRVHIQNHLTPNPPNTVRITRPSRWGNPYRVESWGEQWQVLRKWKNGDHCCGVFYTKRAAVAKAVSLFRFWLTCTPEGKALVAEARRELAGKDLACTCKPGEPCHGDVWIEVLG